MQRKNICQTIKKISVLFANFDFDVCLIFLLRYYGSCYRLQHVEKGKERNTEEDKNDMPKKSKHVKKEKHVKEKQTCQKRETCRKSKERRKKTEKKRAKIARCLRKRLRPILYFSYQFLQKHFLLFKHFCTLSWGAYSTNFHLFFL